MNTAKRPKILTWHVHGSYLYYLTQANADFYLPVGEGDRPGYGGRSGSFPWGKNVFEIPARQVRKLALDCVVFQSPQNYFEDQYEVLSAAQRRLPRMYIEHDPPREHPTDTKHIVDDPSVLLVHVTDFNNLMWDNGQTPTTVIDHGVMVPGGVAYTGEIPKGIVVINNIATRGRRLGLDVLNQVRKAVPLDIVGMGAEAVGGLGEIPHDALPAFVAKYRFFFNPIRYTSLGLAICEAMLLGVPVVGLATTELVTVIRNGKNGYIETSVANLIPRMQQLLADRTLAERLSKGARSYANKRFSIERFARDWERTFQRQIQGEG